MTALTRRTPGSAFEACRSRLPARHLTVAELAVPVAPTGGCRLRVPGGNGLRLVIRIQRSNWFPAAGGLSDHNSSAAFQGDMFAITAEPAYPASGAQRPSRFMVAPCENGVSRDPWDSGDPCTRAAGRSSGVSHSRAKWPPNLNGTGK